MKKNIKLSSIQVAGILPGLVIQVLAIIVVYVKTHLSKRKATT